MQLVVVVQGLPIAVEFDSNDARRKFERDVKRHSTAFQELKTGNGATINIAPAKVSAFGPMEAF